MGETSVAAACRPSTARSLAVGHPHNAAIQIWAELGAVGAILAAGVARPRLAIDRGTCRAPRFGAASRALLAAIAAVSLVGHGAWQGWWAAAIGAAIVWFRLPSATLGRTWNAMSDFDVDLFVIGGGSGGVRAGRIAAGYGARVMLAEEYRVGGTCVIRGCVPKKLMVYASRFADEFDDAAGFGWTVAEPRFDWATLIRNKDAEIDRLEEHLPRQSRQGRRRDRRRPRRDRGRAYGAPR